MASHFALIPAAGVGARMGGDCPKQYLPLLGSPMLWHTVQAFLASPGIVHTYVVVSRDDGYIDQVFPARVPGLTILRCGGETRYASVLQGLQALSDLIEPDDWVLVHDAARPGVTPELIARLKKALATHAVGGLLAMPVVDTVKQKLGDQIQTLDRNQLWLAQTPQMFRYRVLLGALQQADPKLITDEASAVEAMGLTPALVPGHARNLKLTVPDDVAFLEAYLTFINKT